MPYNKSKACVRRMLPFLSAMDVAKQTITWPVKDKTNVFAYKIREAMDTATLHPEFTHLHHLKDNYRIHPRSGWVEAEWIGADLDYVGFSTPSAMEVPEAIDAQGVVGACIKFAVKADEIHFPNASLNEKEKLAIYKWGRSEEHGPHWKLISHDGKGVTMTRKAGVSEIFLWEPKVEA